MLPRNEKHHIPYNFTLKRRLGAAAIGIVLVFVGLVRQVSGETVLIHWTGQQQYSYGVIAAGGFMLLISLVPNSWLDRLFYPRASGKNK
jgi:hypothetical protein